MGEDGFTTIRKSKEPLTREEVYEREASKLASGTKVTLIHFRKIGLDCIDIKLGLVECGEEDCTSTVRVVTTITAGQAVTSKEIDESPESNLFFPTSPHVAPSTIFTKVTAAKCACACALYRANSLERRWFV